MKIQPSLPEVAPGFMQHLAAQAGGPGRPAARTRMRSGSLVLLGRRSRFSATRRTPCRSTPAPADGGTINTVTGSATSQCTALATR